MTALKPGWCESLGKVSASQDEQERSAALGFKPRKAWSEWRDAAQTSRLRGAHKRQRPLPKLEFPEDNE